MNHSGYIYEELKALTPFLAELEKTNIFSIPENYFSGLDEEIMNRINDPFYILPASKTAVFTTPEGYFETLAGSILQKIKDSDHNEGDEEIKLQCPALYSARNKNIFTVPGGYFETFPASILDVVRPQAKVVVMKKRSMLWNCAVAAMITGIMAMSALWVSNMSSQQNLVAGTNTIRADVKDALKYANEQQVDDGIAALSDADIVSYLQNTGSDADDDALASGIPEKELPAEKDYLTDENTLQKFLGKIESRNNQN